MQLHPTAPPVLCDLGSFCSQLQLQHRLRRRCALPPTSNAHWGSCDRACEPVVESGTYDEEGPPPPRERFLAGSGIQSSALSESSFSVLSLRSRLTGRSAIASSKGVLTDRDSRHDKPPLWGWNRRHALAFCSTSVLTTCLQRAVSVSAHQADGRLCHQYLPGPRSVEH